MKILTYIIVCWILFTSCVESKGESDLTKTLKYMVGGVCLLCLTLLSIFG